LGRIKSSPVTDASEQILQKRAVFWASMALFGLSAITALALVAWFSSHKPWGFIVVVEMMVVALSITAGALVWRAPSRTHVFAGMTVMAFSLLRLGAPPGWGTSHYVTLAITVALFAPLVRAVLLLPRS
jgi:hypothetical protein